MKRSELTEEGLQYFTSYILRNPDGTAFQHEDGKDYELKIDDVKFRNSHLIYYCTVLEKNTEIELTEKELRWVKRVSKAFDELQDFLEKKVKK